MQRGGAGIPPRRRWRVGRSHAFSVQVRDESIIVFHAQDQLVDHFRLIHIKRVPKVKCLIAVVHCGAEIQGGTDQRHITGTTLITGAVAAPAPVGIIKIYCRPFVVVAVTARHPAPGVAAWADQRLHLPGDDQRDYSLCSLAQCILDRVLDLPRATRALFCLEAKQPVGFVSASTVLHNGRTMHGQGTQPRRLGARADKTESARKIVLTIFPFAGGSHPDDRLGFVHPAPTRSVVVHQRVKMHRLAGAENDLIRFSHRRVVDIVQLQRLTLTSRSILDCLAALRIGVHPENEHRVIAGQFMQLSLLGRAQLRDCAVSWQLDGLHLPHGDIHFIHTPLGIANDYGHVPLVKPTRTDVATHRIAEPCHANKSTGRLKHRPPVLHGNGARIARCHLPHLSQRQIVFSSALDLLQVVRDHVVADLLADSAPRDVVVGKRHLRGVTHVCRAAQPTGGPPVYLLGRGDLLPLDIAEKRAVRVVVLSVHNAAQRVGRTKHVPHLVTRQRPAETGS